MTDITEVLSTNTAAVVEQALIAFGAGMTLQSRTDVKTSFQFASRVASKLYDQEGQGEAWFKQFLKVMQDCGWVTVRRSYEKDHSATQSLKVGAIAFKAVSAVGTAVLGGPIGAAMTKLAGDALSQLGLIEEATDLLNRNIKDYQSANIGLASCLETSEGEVVMSMSAVNTDKSGHDLDAAVFEWSSKSEALYSGVAVLSFNKALYEKVRETIVTKLGDRMIENVLDYDI